jgi:hypothetical protein
MNLPVPRRRQPWGALWAKAPWDGTPVVEEQPRMPATIAAPLPMPSHAPLSRRRQSFGTLLRSVPWAGRPKSVAVEATSDTLNDFPVDSMANEDTTLEVL